MKDSLISICIPTYNRAERLEQSLKSTIGVIEKIPEFCLCISDNASSDNTCDKINEFKKIYPNIEVNKNEVNLGFKKNFINVLSMANSKYCWLMGDDDYLVDDGTREVARYVADSDNTYDLIIVNGFSGSKPVEQKTKIFTDRNDVLFYLGAHMSWISSIIFSRSFLIKHNILEKMDASENAFPHITAIFASLPKKCKVLWIANATVMPIGGFTAYYNKWIDIFVKDWFLVIENVKNKYSSKAIISYLNKTPISVRFLLKGKYNGFLDRDNLYIIFKYSYKYPKGYLWLISFCISGMIPNFLFDIYNKWREKY